MPPPLPPPFAIASNGQPAQGLGERLRRRHRPEHPQQPYCCCCRRRGAREGGGEALGFALCATWRGAPRYIQRAAAAARPPPAARPSGTERAGRSPPRPAPCSSRAAPAPSAESEGGAAGRRRPGSAPAPGPPRPSASPGCPRLRAAARRAPRVCAALRPGPLPARRSGS